MTLSGRLIVRFCLSAAAALVIAAPLPAGQQFPGEPPAPTFDDGAEEAAPEEAPPEPDARSTAGGALRAFLSVRDYRTIRELKGTMTPELTARFDRDSTPFCGKRGIRLAGFDFTEKDLKPAKTPATAAAASSPAEGPAIYLATVRSLWEEQGEAVERRVETVRLARQVDGLWRAAGLERVSSEPLRFTEQVDGVTTLRMVLRAWRKGDADSARPHLGSSFLKRSQGSDEAWRAIFDFRAAGPRPRHLAYQIVDVTPHAPAAAVARVRLFHGAAPGEPARLDGAPATLKLVRSGARWLVDGWDEPLSAASRKRR